MYSVYRRCTRASDRRGGIRGRDLQPVLVRVRLTGKQPDVLVGATGFWNRLLGGLNSGRTSENDAARKKLRKASSELQRLLCDSEAPDLARVNELLDELISAEGQQFLEKSLGGGPWVVRYTRGKPLLWNVTYSTGRLVNSGNRAAQEFEPASRSALNLVEINGPDNRIEASGTYEPVDDSRVTPKTIRANIRAGRLVLGSWELPLPISGTGLFDVVYVDDALRVFRSNSRFAVQVRADRLASPQ